MATPSSGRIINLVERDEKGSNEDTYSNAIRAHYNYAVAVSDYQRITAQ